MSKVYFVIFLLIPIITFPQEENLKVLDQWLKYSDIKNSLYHYYCDQAFQFLDKREAEISKLKTKEDWEKRKEKVKETLIKVVGPFPEKTPLNAKITGVLKKDNYRVEKIIYESQPNFYVTAAMFIPNNIKGKTPAIILTSGHIIEAFRWLDYQKVILNFVKKGFIVFAFDPIGQGERIQYYSSELQKSLVGTCVDEHTYVGMQCILTGSTLARYMIWDGIRAIDYLLTRDEVDPDRIGITGHSGGGTQSAYIAAFDDKILAVAPECYLTSMRRLWERQGPQDAEQNFIKGIASGLDLADLIEVRAPKPALQISLTQDFFSIQGARETENEIKKEYKLFNAEDNFYRIEDDAPHGVTKKNRVKRNAFFQKQLNLPGDPKDDDIDFLTPKELQITKTGQLATSLKGETVFTLNKKETEKLVKKLEEARKDVGNHLKSVVQKAKKLSGYISPAKIDGVVFTGRYQRDGYSIEKYFMKGEGDYPIPFLLFIPNKKAESAIIYLNPDGKEVDASIGGDIELLVKKGNIVLAPDLVGTGEMGPNLSLWSNFASNLGAVSYKHWFGPVQIGRSVVAIHASDIQRLVMFLNTKIRIDKNKIYAIAKGNSCPALIHVAAFEKSFKKIALINPLVSYSSIALNKFYYATPVMPIVPSVLTTYDLPDLEAAVAPNKLFLINVKNQLGNNASEEVINNDLSIVKKSFKKRNATDNLKIIELQPQQKVMDVYFDWLK